MQLRLTDIRDQGRSPRKDVYNGETNQRNRSTRPSTFGGEVDDGVHDLLANHFRSTEGQS